MSGEQEAGTNEVQVLIRQAEGEIRSTLDRLRRHLAAVERTDPPLIDGVPAADEVGEPLDVVEWLRDRIDGLCEEGTMAGALEELAREGRADPVEAIRRYVLDSRVVMR